uniref:asparagine synthase (glutamine-hydrolyzing) n=1 Tax=Flavobacterium sp. TaxID=239 RepID=UPI00404AAFBA
YDFITNTDTEVILKAFDKWGLQCVDKFIGMFSFVIHKDNKVFFCRDRAGVKPLFYYFNNKILLFASELKSIIECDLFPKEIDNSGLISYLKYGYIENSKCIYKDTFKLNPGSWMILDLESFSLKFEKYWGVENFYSLNKTHLNYSEVIEKTEDVLLNSFKLRMISDVPVGIFLSGGYDSNCLAGMLGSTNNYELKTFSVGFENYRFNETSISKLTSNHIGTNHTEIICTKSDILSSYNKISHFYDEPFSDISSIPSMIVCDVAKSSGVTVALSADGGDEIFGGYNKYINALNIFQRVKKYKFLPNEILDLFSKISSSLLDQTSASYIKEHLELINKKIKLLNINQPEKILEEISLIFSYDEINIMLREPILLHSVNDQYESSESIVGILDKMLCVDYKTYMRDDILTKMDRAGMSSSLEVREPFLDHRIIEWVAMIPEEYKISSNLITKSMLKDITHKYVPEEFLNKKKQGFGFPVLDYLDEVLNIEVSNYLNMDYIIRQNIFNPVFIENLVKRYKSNPSKYFKKIWVLINFQVWYNKWIITSY